MVEVVHDFLTYVQAGLDVSREDAKKTHSSCEVCLLAEDAADPCRGRDVAAMADMQKADEHTKAEDLRKKPYSMQVTQFGLRCTRVLPEIDQALTDVKKMIDRQPHCESSAFSRLLKVV